MNGVVIVSDGKGIHFLQLSAAIISLGQVIWSTTALRPIFVSVSLYSRLEASDILLVIVLNPPCSLCYLRIEIIQASTNAIPGLRLITWRPLNATSVKFENDLILLLSLAILPHLIRQGTS